MNKLLSTLPVILSVAKNLTRMCVSNKLRDPSFRFTSLRMTQAGFIKITKKTLVMILIFSILLPTIILYSLFIIPKTAKAEWFDDTWGYRTSYSNNNTGSAVTNQKVKLDIDTATLITNSKLQSDCDDSRFTDQNGNLLDYFIDTIQL